ncbi:hypothetical protein [Thalassospira australica]|uniref:hypothetical protein n=1 Tax=Thalassospira australica TaxID=1528106 RepID=UPI000B22DFB8|nr:hypothetical protein [Thalassospira australica]
MVTASKPSDCRKYARFINRGRYRRLMVFYAATFLSAGMVFGWGSNDVAAQNADLRAASGVGDIPVFTDTYQGAEFCADGSTDQPCDRVPVDVPEFDASFVYRFLAYHAQRPFDRFSWQAFTALMAPLDAPDRQALWESFPTRRDLFADLNYPNRVCASDLPDGHLLLASYLQSTGDILIDQAGNFVLFETRINPVAADYIRANNLHMPAGRAAFAHSGQAIEFPTGHVLAGDNNADPNSSNPKATGDETATIPRSAPGVMGAQLLKFAWRIMPGNDASAVKNYVTRPARISVGADQTLDGRAKCLDVTVGLVGLHLVQRVASGNGDRWIWSSFEHVDNVPLAANARRPNSIITDDPFENGCLAPGKLDRNFAFYGGQLAANAPANQSVSGDMKWADHAPYARLPTGKPARSPDIVRCWRLFSGTAESNFVWQGKLDGTVWQNYMLLGTQWIGNPGGAPFGIGEVPRYLTNSVLESFMQDQSDATCLGCHATATSDAGQQSNFTFLLDPAL